MSNMDDLEQAYGAQGAHEIDYRETSDLTHVHAAIAREKKEPWSANIPIPLWLMCVFFLVFGWGTYYLGMFCAGYNGDVFDERSGLSASSTKAGGAGPEAEAGPVTVVDQGKKVFKDNCAVCHQPTGTGVPGQYPPLAKSEYVNGTPKRLAMILLKGLQGPIKVEGSAFGSAAMPPWEKTLNDKKIAAVLTYIRQEWGNTAGEVAPEQIAHARKDYKDRVDSWSEADLLAVPADAVLEGAPAPAAPAPAAGAAPAAAAAPGAAK